jgi:hypothetical protein
MGFFALLFDWKVVDGGAASENPRSRAVIEPLERRMLFDVQVNSPAFDVPGECSDPLYGCRAGGTNRA